MKLNHIIPVIIGAIALTACEKDPFTEIAGPPSLPGDAPASAAPGRYIVQFADDFGADALKSATGYDMARDILGKEISLALKAGGISAAPEQVYTSAFKGFSINVSDPVQVILLEKLKGVINVEPDQVFSVSPPVKTESLSGAKSYVSYGILRVGSADGTGKRAWIVDTGIDMDHPDLNVNSTLSRSFVSNFSLLGVSLSQNPEDGNGHGTHVAGIIAAKYNMIGVTGVAYNAEVVAIKVLADNGSGYTSDIIAGLDYVAANAKPGEAVNLSLGGGISKSLDNAVIRIGKKGIRVAMAAGNSAISATRVSPARANGINLYTVSAMDNQDNFAYYSNYGNPPVDYCAPGTAIYSTYKNGSYASLSGTSMAAPHVCGILLLRSQPAISGRVKNDPDGNADYIAHL